MRNQIIRILGMLSFLVGLIFFIQPSFTGFVVARDISNLGDFIGIIFVLVGIVLVGMARKPDYNHVAAQVYQHLFLKGGYGHHTESTETAASRIARGDISKQEVRRVIASEVSAGRLHLPHPNSIALPVTRSKLDEIGELYGEHMRPAVNQRLRELRERHRLGGR